METANQTETAMQINIDSAMFCEFISNFLVSGETLDVNSNIYQILMMILPNHPDWKLKSEGMDRLIIVSKNGIRKIGILHTNGTVEDIDYHKAVYDPVRVNNMRIAFRRHILTHLLAFAFKCRNDKTLCKCELCGVSIPNTRGLTMHSPFLFMIEGFMQENKLPIVNSYISFKTNKHCIADYEIRRKWVEYFLKNADMKFTCNDCFNANKYNVTY